CRESRLRTAGMIRGYRLTRPGLQIPKVTRTIPRLPMTSYRKNLMVGAVVLGAIVTLGWMILKFGERPAALLSPPQIAISFISDRADGLSEGSQVTYRGVQVGRVTTVTRLPDNLLVRIEAQLDKNPALPANVTGAIERQSFLGSGSSISL